MKCENFAKSLLQIINDLRQKGWTDFGALPNFSRSELSEILGLSKKSKVLIGEELARIFADKHNCECVAYGGNA
jgi:hypothetical protein